MIGPARDADRCGWRPSKRVLRLGTFQIVTHSATPRTCKVSRLRWLITVDDHLDQQRVGEGEQLNYKTGSQHESARRGSASAGQNQPGPNFYWGWVHRSSSSARSLRGTAPPDHPARGSTPCLGEASLSPAHYSRSLGITARGRGTCRRVPAAAGTRAITWDQGLQPADRRTGDWA